MNIKTVDVSKLYQVHKEIIYTIEGDSQFYANRIYNRENAINSIITRYGEHLLESYKQTLLYGQSVSIKPRIYLEDIDDTLYVSNIDTGISTPYNMVKLVSVSNGKVYVILK